MRDHYRRSRASHNLFYHIHTIVSNRVNQVNAYQPTIDRTPGLFSKAVKCIKLDTENKHQDVTCGLLNCRSAGNKSQRIQTEIINNKLDILALTETWFKEGDNIIPPRRTCPTGYKITSVPRCERSGGGIALIHSDDIQIDKFHEHKFSSMECSDFKLHIGKQKSPVNLAVLYKPPNTSILQFTLDLAQYLESSITDHGEHILCGDFNIKVSDTQDPNTITFQDFLDRFNLKNNVLFPTHKHNNTLDLIISSQQSETVQGVTQGPLISDHNIIVFKLKVEKAPSQTKKIAYHKLDDINSSQFRSRLRQEIISTLNNEPTLETSVDRYHHILKDLLDEFVPIQEKTVKLRKNILWYNKEIRNKVRVRCKLERIWKNDINNIDKYNNFYAARRDINNLLRRKEKSYYQNQLQDSKRDIKKIFTICNDLLGRKTSSALPEANSKQKLPDRLSTYFRTKI